jgi:hypothetical protein
MQADLIGNSREVDYFKIADNNSSEKIVGNHKKAKARWMASIREFKMDSFLNNNHVRYQ